MDYYVINRSMGVTTFFGGTAALRPRGEKGDAKRIPSWAREHSEIKELEGAKKVRVVTEDEYRALLAGTPVVAKAPAPAPVVDEAPEPEPEEEEAPELEEEEEEEEEEAPELLSLDAFEELKADKQKEYLTDLGVEGDFGNGAKRAAAYKGHLESAS